jgi:SAM-dependent methyltransferase
LNTFEELFSDIVGGRVLDVACGEGGFITILQSYLGSVTSISGIDLNEKALRGAISAFDLPNIQFLQMNGEHLGFESGEFDTVNISASLHHLENVSRVLAEMKRVLKSGGKFILTEMHRDGTSQAQFNAIRIHHWAAAVDSSLGVLHDRTFSRQEILSFINELDLGNVITRDFSTPGSSAPNEKTMAGVRGYLDHYHRLLGDQPGSQILIQQEDELRTALRETGFQHEPVLIVVAEKL